MLLEQLKIEIAEEVTDFRHKKSRQTQFKELSAKVPRSRFELPRPYERHPLKMVRLPISPPGLMLTFGITKIKNFQSFTSRKYLFKALFY